MNFGSSYIYVPQANASDDFCGDDCSADLISLDAAPPPAEPLAPVVHEAGLPSIALASAPAPAAAGPRRAVAGRRVRIAAPQAPAANTNVVSVHIGSLEKVAQVLTGDPTFCSSCKAIYNAESHRALEAKQAQLGAAQSGAIWECEFCGQCNSINLSPEEVPKDKTLDYIMEPALPGKQTSSVVIYCIDLSGSMCQTQEVQGLMQLKGVQLSNKLASFNDGSVQFMPGQRQDSTWISRLQCVQAAVEAQLIALSVSEPETRVGLVTFNSEVTIIGDGTQDPIHVAGDKLMSYEALIAEGKAFGAVKPIKETKDVLIRRIYELEEGGATALGPAMAVCIGIASQSGTAKIVAATDGLSNVGIGAMDTLNSAESLLAVQQLYLQMGVYAKQNSIAISVISIKGEGCNLQFLGQLADSTAGIVQIVDPLLLKDNFANVLANRLVATKCTVSMILHKGLCFINEGNAQQRVTRDVGNVFADSELPFEFAMRPIEEGGKDAPKSLPFQVQIVYSKFNGMKCVRVITEQRQTTSDIARVEQALNFNVVSNNAFGQAAKLAQQGRIEEAIARTSGVSGYMQSVAAANPLTSQLAEHAQRFSRQMASEQAQASTFAGFTFNAAPQQAFGAPSAAGHPSAAAMNPLFSDSASEMIYGFSSTSNPLFKGS